MVKAFSIDIGGTKIYSAIVDEKGEIIGEVKKNDTPKTINGIIETLKTIIKTHENEVDIVTIATAGAVNRENTRVIGSTGNLPKNYKDIDFQSLSKKPVFLENDANAAACAEYYFLEDKNIKDIIVLTLGTGVGGGIIVNGELLKGKNGAAGEMHFKMSLDNKRKCSCGAYDCFEIYTSGRGLQMTVKELTNLDMTTYEIIEKMKSSKEIMAAVEVWWKHLAVGITGLVDIFDPDVVILSGSMEQFVDTDYVEKIVNSEIVTTPTKVLHAKLKNYSGLIGVAVYGIKKLIKNKI